MIVATHLGVDDGDGDRGKCRFHLASGPVRRGQMVRGSADGIVWRPISRPWRTHRPASRSAFG